MSQFGNLTGNSTPYYPLASTYVGGFLQALMIVAISTSALAYGLAFHNGMVRYLYAMGREGILGKVFGKTHPRYRSPNIAIITQSLFSVLLILFFALVVQKTDGSLGFGIADGKTTTQVDGILPYTWLAITEANDRDLSPSYASCARGVERRRWATCSGSSICT